MPYGYPRGYRFRYETVIAKCRACGQNFKWLPENFDMKHRFNSETHLYCGGVVEKWPTKGRDWLDVGVGQSTTEPK